MMIIQICLSASSEGDLAYRILESSFRDQVENGKLSIRLGGELSELAENDVLICQKELIAGEHASGREKIKVIMLIDHLEEALEGYGLGVFRCVPIEMLHDRLPGAVEEAIYSHMSAPPRMLITNYIGGILRIDPRQICFVRREERRLCIYLDNGSVFQKNDSLQSFLSELRDDRFIKIDKGCFINLYQVKALNGLQVEMLGHAGILEVSRRMRPLLKAAMHRGDYLASISEREENTAERRGNNGS